MAPFVEPDRWMYAGAALFFVGIAWRLIRWVARTAKDLNQEPPYETAARLQAIMAKPGDRTDADARSRHDARIPVMASQAIRCPVCGTDLGAATEGSTKLTCPTCGGELTVRMTTTRF